MVTIDGTGISGVTIDGQNVQEITIDGEVAWTSSPSNAILQTKMDEGSGTTLADSIGTNSATLNGGSWTQNNDYEGGFGVSFGGGDNIQYSSTNSTFSVNGTWAIGITIQKDFSGFEEVPISHTLNSSDLHGVQIDGNEIRFGLFDGSYNSASISEPSAPYLIRLLVGANNGAPELYLNTTEATDDRRPSLTTESGFYIGQDTGGDGNMSGLVDHLIGYNVAPNQVVQEDYDLQPWTP